MPRLHNQILDCVVYLYPSVKASVEGEPAGGTGFLVSIPSQVRNDLGYTYVVTNSHVVKEGRSTIMRLNDRAGQHVTYEVPADHWVHHPDGDDVAACKVSLSTDRFAVSWMLLDQFATREAVRRYDIGPGDDVCMIGRYVTHDGTVRNLPSVRFGNIAMMPWQPIISPRGLRQESYLVECRSLPGFSGSPVFVYGGPIAIGHERTEALPFLLLGIDWCHPTHWESVHERDAEGSWRKRDDLGVRSNGGMAGVVPAWKIQELLEGEPFFSQRKEEDEGMAGDGVETVP